MRFLVPSADVLSFYAATDAYVAPSLEDAFGLPILEAMACGLPVIASVQAGASENIIDGTTGYLLRDPMNHVELAELIRRLAGDRSAAQKVGAAACPVRESFGQLGSQCFSDPQVFGRRVNFETHLKCHLRTATSLLRHGAFALFSYVLSAILTALSSSS